MLGPNRPLAVDLVSNGSIQTWGLWVQGAVEAWRPQYGTLSVGLEGLRKANVGIRAGAQ